eukprot:2212338-Pleurochrysis_carterae.AAC.2
MVKYPQHGRVSIRVSARSYLTRNVCHVLVDCENTKSSSISCEDASSQKLQKLQRSDTRISADVMR